MKYLKLIFLLIGLTFLCSCACASVLIYTGSVIVKDESNYTIQKLYDNLYPTYGNSILYNDSNGVWYTTRAIGCDNSDFYISPETGVNELRMDTTGLKYLYSTVEGTRNGFIIDNITFTGWNSTANAPMTNVYNKAVEIYKGNVDNTTFHNVQNVKLYTVSNQEIRNITYEGCFGHLLIYNASNVTISNITVQDLYQPTLTSGYSFCLSNSENCTVRDVVVHNTTKYGMDLQHCKYTEAYRLDIRKIDSYLAQSTGREGFSTVSCNHTTVHDVYIDDTGWSSLCPGGDYGYYYNIVVKNTGHNALDCHNVFNSYFENLTLIVAPTANYTDPADKNTNTMIFTAGYVEAPHTTNVTVKNATLIDGPVAIDTGVDHLYFENIHLTGENPEFSISADYCTLKNVTMIGNSGNESKARIQIWAGHTESAYNVSLIDTLFHRISAQQGTRNRLLNSKYTDATYNNHTNYYYLDVAIKDVSGNLLDGIISVTNINNSSDIYSSVDGNAENKASFNTTSGRMYLPIQNRNESGSIADVFCLSVTKTYFKHNLSVSTSSGNVLLTGIDPDSSWYRPDPNIPTYTITAIIPDDSPGPHITGFAPSEENPFNPGDEKIFRVWTDENLTSMEWYVDGLPVSKGLLSYTWTVTEGDHAIEFRGANENGTVSQSWNIGEYTGALPAPIIEFFPADAILTRNTGENVTFSVNSDQLLTVNWFINGQQVRDFSTSITQSWDAPGTYNVTVDGASGEETIMQTWMVDVVEPVKSLDASNVTLSPEYQTVTPGQPFAVDVWIEPGTAINGAQFDLSFNSSMVKVDSVTEGNLLNQDGAKTIFINGTINNTAGTVTDVYGSILASNVSSPGVFATISMTAGSNTGVAELKLSNVIVSDSNSKATPISISNATLLVDTAPVLNTIGSRSVSETNLLNFEVDARDADGDSLTYSAAGLPEGANFDPASGVFTWTPARGQEGVYTATFEVSDGYLSDSEDVTITVNPANNIPVINSFEPENGSSFNEKEKINILVNASDPDGQSLSYIIKIDGVTFSTEPSYIWKTGYSSSGEHTVEVTVSDGIDQVKDQHIIYVKDYHPSWDVNEDDEVNILDIANVSQRFGTTTTEPYPRWDVVEYGQVDILDLSFVGSHFGEKMV